MVLYTPCGLLLWADRVQSHRRIQRSRHYPGSTPWHHPASGPLCTAPESQAHTYIYVNKVDVTVCVCVVQIWNFAVIDNINIFFHPSLYHCRCSGKILVCVTECPCVSQCVFGFFYLITTLGIVILHGEYPITTRRHHYIYLDYEAAFIIKAHPLVVLDQVRHFLLRVIDKLVGSGYLSADLIHRNDNTV